MPTSIAYMPLGDLEALPEEQKERLLTVLNACLVLQTALQETLEYHSPSQSRERALSRLAGVYAAAREGITGIRDD